MIEDLIAGDREKELTYAEVQDVFEYLLRLDYHPVAVKFLFTDEEAEEYKQPERFTAKTTFCQYVAAARMGGYVLRGCSDGLLCENAQTTLGFREPPPEEYRSHLKYVLDPDFARDVVATKPRLPFGKLKAFLTAPLGKTVLDPDVVIFICNPFQAYHILNDYIGAFKVHPLQFNHTVNSAVCGGAVWTYLNRRPNMNTMCSGSYTSGKTEKGEVNLFIPGDQIIRVAAQLLKRTREYGGPTLLNRDEDFPGFDRCKKCSMLRIKRDDDVDAAARK